MLARAEDVLPLDSVTVSCRFLDDRRVVVQNKRLRERFESHDFARDAKRQAPSRSNQRDHDWSSVSRQFELVLKAAPELDSLRRVLARIRATKRFMARSVAQSERSIDES